MNNIETLQKLVQTFEKDVDSYKESKTNFNEQMTRQQYIDVFLSLLGWDVRNPRNLSFNDREVVVEEYLNRKDRPDYTIRMNGTSIFFVEAKKVNVDIKNEIDPALQTRRYGWNAGHKVSILTNFEYFIIYTTFKQPSNNDKVTTERYKVFHYTEYLEKFNEIYTLLSRESVLNGTFEKWTSEITPADATKMSLDQVFLEQLNSWRLLVANDLYHTNKKKFADSVELNEKVQIFLNQIIFLRFAEDNQFEKFDELKMNIEAHVDYRHYFKGLDVKYNAGLFKDATIITNVSDDTLKEIVENLYFPTVSYDFSIIDLSILSRIYENFLQQEIVVTDSGVILEKTKDAKVKAVVSTPDTVVKMMVRDVLSKKISGLNPSQILKLRIADLAVGSGIFLIEAYNFIEEYLVDWYAQTRKCQTDRLLVPFEIKKDIIKQVFRGYDINPLAVQLTRFSMLLRLLSFEKNERIRDIQPILPSLEKTIISGNTLVDENDLEIDKISVDNLIEIFPMSEDTGFQIEKFDVILGNPPYLKTEEIKKTTPKSELEVYKRKYRSSFKQYDKYFLFIERILSKLKEDGIAELLVPNKFFTVSAGVELRRLIREKNGINKIFDFKYTQIFPSVTNYVAIIQFSNFESSLFKYSTLKSVNESYQDYESIEYDVDKLADSHWFLTDDNNLRKRFEYVTEYFPNIESEISPVNGIQTSANEVYLIEKKYMIHEDSENIYFEKKNDKFQIEKNMVRDFFKKNQKIQGKSYQTLEADFFVIFPYINGKIICEEEMKSSYPNTYEYLVKRKEKLLPKSMGGKRDVPDAVEWYQFARNQFLKESSSNKILVGVMSKQPNFNIDRNNMLFASGGTAGDIALLLKENSLYCLEYIQAWLSHPFVDSIFKVIGSSFEGDFYSHGTDMYDAIPLLPIDFSDSDEVIIYNDIVANVRKIEELNLSLKQEESERKRQFLSMKVEGLIKSINRNLDELLESKVKI